MKKKVVAGIVVMLVLVLLLPVSLRLKDGGKNTMNKEQKSYACIAEILKKYGISGITDEMLNELEEGYAKLPPEILFDKTATLLSVLGSGTINYDTWEFTPSENGVYSFDAEVFDVGNMYTNFLRGISAIGGEELVFTDIQEDTSGVDWEEGTGRRTVSFQWNGNSYTLEAEAMSDWFDFSVADELNKIIMAGGNGKQLFFASDGYQECIVFYCDADWAEAFEKETGLSLSGSAS